MTKLGSRFRAVILTALLGANPGAGAFAQTPGEAAPDAASAFEAELERRGALIGSVNIVVENVFDLANPAEDKALYRFANRVHVTTREGVVESLLLFESGDLFEARLLDESARLIRSRGYVADAAVRPGTYNEATNTVDIDINVRDAWSLKPFLKLSRGGGENEYGLGLTEDNLLGRGKQLDIAYTRDIDRDEQLFSYTDTNINGGRTRLNVLYSDNSDGKRAAIAAGRPFFSLDTRWSLTGNALDDERIDSMYDLGAVIDEFRHDTRAFSIQGGKSRGFVDGRTRRWLAGFSYEEDIFLPTADLPEPLLLPENRKLAYPWAGFQLLGDDFREVSELNDMGRTEDVSLGLNLFLSLGLSSKSFGADRDAWIFNASAARGWEPGGPGRLLLFNAGASARWEDHGLQNGLLFGSARYFHRNLGRHLFSASLRATMTNNLDAENQVLLGGDNDLRGYPLRYQSGERSAVLTLEQRFFTDWYPFRLIRMGYAVFFDAGRVWGTDPRNTPNVGTLYDIGVGLRLTSPRSSGRSVIHIDLAFPLNGDSTIDDVQLIVEKKASF